MDRYPRLKRLARSVVMVVCGAVLGFQLRSPHRVLPPSEPVTFARGIPGCEITIPEIIVGEMVAAGFDAWLVACVAHVNSTSAP